MSHRHRRRWTETEVAFLKENRRGHTRAWLAEELGRKPEAIKHKITELQALKFKVRVYNARSAKVPSGQKLCRRCGLVKPIEDFHRQTRSKDGHQSRCKPCAVALSSQWNREHPEAFAKNMRTHHLRKAYGLSREQFAALLEHQAGLCPVCNVALDHRIAVDHDHASGRVRGLLHVKCNAALGALHDSIDSLQRAIAYLKQE